MTVWSLRAPGTGAVSRPDGYGGRSNSAPPKTGSFRPALATFGLRCDATCSLEPLVVGTATEDGRRDGARDHRIPLPHASLDIGAAETYAVRRAPRPNRAWPQFDEGPSAPRGSARTAAWPTQERPTLMDRLVTLTEAALLLGSTPSRVMQLCHTGELPSGELGGTMVIPTSAVNQYASRLRGRRSLAGTRPAR